VLAGASGSIHIKAAIDHTGDRWLFGVFFAGLAYGQLACASA